MIFIDTNVPMYLVGADHPHKAEATRLLERAASNRERLVTDAEVLQEILHRYVAIARRDAKWTGASSISIPSRTAAASA